MQTRQTLSTSAGILAISLLLACGGSEGESGASAGASAAPGAATAQPRSDVKLTGRIVEVTMHTDEKGNYFEPANLTVQEGDVVRFKLATGVHNVHFLPDSNRSAKWLPPMSGFLQLPGQTLDIPMTFEEGVFYYQCDPHALLGMVGRITVRDED